MARRIHVPKLGAGHLPLDPSEAHHLRDVLRLTVGTQVELFDDSGQTAMGTIRSANAGAVVVEVQSVTAPAAPRVALTVAAAVPKGDRADWMVEKLSELGVARFIPLATERSVVHPSGKNKIDRWERIAVESAKQSRRAGVMQIAELTALREVQQAGGEGWFLSTALPARPIRQLLSARPAPINLTLFIGPEGGWTDEETAAFERAGVAAAGLTATILRVETAAIAAAGFILCWVG